MPDTRIETPPAGLATTSLRIIATAIIFACIYYASSILITLICALFIAFVLDPGVAFLERMRVPRWLGSLAMVLLALSVLYLMVYLVYDRTLAFIRDLPHLIVPLQRAVFRLQTTVRDFWQRTSNALPTNPGTNLPMVQLQQGSSWVQFVERGFGPFYAFTVSVLFIPFLVFFMLTSKDQMWAATLNLFPRERRQQAEDVFRGLSHMVRQYVLGNILVALISAALILPVLVFIDLRYALIVGPVAAFLSLIPYIGLALSLLPPLLIALVQYDRVGPFLTITLTLVAVHFLAANVLTPKLVGRSVKLNALTVTLAMMFWGWMWGGIGLLLAVPITAGVKAICDNVRSLKSYGAWMGEGG
jgi:predicted PurR-regulated permease PerM